ncbi:unnamed protein product [Paramecium pentaurelia]|uniref:Uncharacterized protein n=1 Tax=Paramecium pentaurelia TaxID=43138 RepID=A0A8S1X1V9_9CILI|nr:unnamed protein product [Paramecium pentaurelia]
MNIKYLNIQQQIVVAPQQPIITVPQQTIVAAAVPPQQPEINEMYHLERELQVLSVEDVEEPWKKKCVEFEIKIFDLQTELARYKILGQELKVTSNEEFQVRELEAKIKMMKDIEDGQRKEIESQQNEIDSRRQRYSKLAEKERQILKLENALNSENVEMQNYMRLIQLHNLKLEQEMSEYQQITKKMKYYSNEADIWKERFMKANQDFRSAQEQWMMAQAKLDSLKKQKPLLQLYNNLIQDLERLVADNIELLYHYLFSNCFLTLSCQHYLSSNSHCFSLPNLAQNFNMQSSKQSFSQPNAQAVTNTSIAIYRISQNTLIIQIIDLAQIF